MYYVYIIKSERTNISYVGMAKDVLQRLNEHNAGKSKFTKGYRPFILIYQEGPFETVEARAREKYLKRSDVKKRIISKGQ